MHFIEHIVEPRKLFLSWQSSSEDCRTRFIVGQLVKQENGQINLNYFIGTKDIQEAIKAGFKGYVAYPDLEKNYVNVLDTFLRRISPRQRGDFSQYLEGLRLWPNVELSDFALLGYSGAKLLSDGFSIIHPFDNVLGPCELLMDVAGYRHYASSIEKEVRINDALFFAIEHNTVVNEQAVVIKYCDQVVGYVNRGLRDTFIDWIQHNRIISAFVEKINGTSNRPALHAFVQIKGV